jgi:hypothetical protein
MDVLNTTGGGSVGLLLILAIIEFGAGLYAAHYVIVAIRNRAYVFATISGVCTVAAILLGILLLNANAPIRHEVTLRPGHVIDATKYEIVEQRGKIYVIEEREAGE